MAVVVSDTSPIRALEWIGQLDLLKFLYGRVVVPPVVRLELLRSGGRYREINVAALDWVDVRQPARTASWAISAGLDAGEAEALSLAVELDAELVLIDESAGRRKARELKLEVRGTAGILLLAKQQGHVQMVKPLLDELRDGLGFFLSDFFVAEVLKRAGECE